MQTEETEFNFQGFESMISKETIQETDDTFDRLIIDPIEIEMKGEEKN